jgi:hypothetical protein
MIQRWFAWLGIVSILIPFPVAIAQLDQSQLKEITVRIDVEGNYKEDGGSGVIVRQQGQFYTILTAYHVVQEKRNYKVLIFNPSNQQIIGSHIINEKNIKQIDDYDLAEITIQSSAKYRTANIGDSQQLQPTDDLTVSGYPLPSSKITKRLSTPTLNLGKFNDKLPPDALLKGKKGATLKMDVATEVGMSGGAVVNKNGELVGILVEADKDASGNKSSSLAIPINLYPQWQAIRNSQRLSSRQPRTTPPSNSTRLDYTSLRDLLASGKWKEADQLTSLVLVMLKEQKKGKDAFCENLRIIDQLWLSASKGKFGFSVQKEIYESLGGTRGYNNAVWKYFGDRVGWRKKGENRWLYYDELTFNAKAPKGHLPSHLPPPTLTDLPETHIFWVVWRTVGQEDVSRLLSCKSL